MSQKTIGSLFAASRLIAKTINRLIVEPDCVDLSSWKCEGKLLCSPSGDCLSSTTLLVKDAHVPTYGIDGRCYGILLDAEKCNIYDVCFSDGNTNRIDKLEKRNKRKGINFLTSNDQGFNTLDNLSNDIKAKGKSFGQLNEVLLDAKKDACIGLFVRYVDVSKANREAMKHYYLTLLEIKLIQKYLIQVFDFPQDLKICQYAETEGKLLGYPSHFNELLQFANHNGINARTYPKLFSLLSDSYQFQRLSPPMTVREYLIDHEAGLDAGDIQKILSRLSKSFVTLDGNKLSPEAIAREGVDDIGIANATIDEMISNYQKRKQKTLGIDSITLGFAKPLSRKTSGCELPMEVEEPELRISMDNCSR